MYKNVVENEYFTTGNDRDILVEVNKTSLESFGIRHPEITVSDASFRAVPQLSEVIKLVRNKHPHWSFKTTISGLYELNPVSDGHKDIETVQVYAGDEHLGWFGWHRKNGWGDKVYAFDNFRLKDKRSRGSSNYSSKAEAAASRIIKTFHSKTPKELMNEAATKAANGVYSVKSGRQSAYINSYRKLSSAVEQFVVDNWRHVQAELGEVAANMDLPELLASHKRGQVLSQAHHDKHGWVILAQTNGRYITKRDDLITTYTDADLPDRLRLGLGLLKMVDADTGIDGIGVRCEDNVFFVMDEVRDETTT